MVIHLAAAYETASLSSRLRIFIILFKSHTPIPQAKNFNIEKWLSIEFNSHTPTQIAISSYLCGT
jgi:hypothetical protein